MGYVYKYSCVGHHHTLSVRPRRQIGTFLGLNIVMRFLFGKITMLRIQHMFCRCGSKFSILYESYSIVYIHMLSFIFILLSLVFVLASYGILLSFEGVRKS